MDIINLISIIVGIVGTYCFITLFLQTMKKHSPSKEKFKCYEIWRPNIPDHGCEKQCNECKKEEQLKLKQ